MLGIILSLVVHSASALSSDKALNYSEMAVKAFASFASPAPPPPNYGIYCPIWASTPDLSPYIIASSDVEGDYVVLKYSVPSNVPIGPYLPRTLIFAWHRDGQFAPWFVYFGSEEIGEVKVNTAGEVAFWRVNAAGAVTNSELRVCSQDSPALNQQDTGYPCYGDISQGRLAATIPHNQPNPLLGGGGYPDGKFLSYDWSGNNLVYTQKIRSAARTELRVQDGQTLQTAIIDSTFSPAQAMDDYFLNQVDSDGEIGYVRFNFINPFSGLVGAVVKGISPVSAGSNVYGAPVTLDQQNGFIDGYLTSNFVKMGGEMHGIYGNFSTNPYALFLKTDLDGFNTAYPRINAPPGTEQLRKPLKAHSNIFGEVLFVESKNIMSGRSRVEIYSYQPGTAGPGVPGNYFHQETIDPIPPATDLMLVGATATDIPSRGGVLAIQSMAGSSFRQHVLLKCW